MFKDDQKDENFDGEVETIVGNSVSLEGNFKSQGSIAINGKVMGKVSTEKNIDVGEEATVKADLEGEDIIVSGKVEGNIKADRLEIKESGEVVGDISTKTLLISEGAKFSGNCQMGEEIKDIPEREEKKEIKVEE